MTFFPYEALARISRSAWAGAAARRRQRAAMMRLVGMECLMMRTQVRDCANIWQRPGGHPAHQRDGSYREDQSPANKLQVGFAVLDCLHSMLWSSRFQSSPKCPFITPCEFSEGIS